MCQLIGVAYVLDVIGEHFFNKIYNIKNVLVLLLSSKFD